MRRWALALILAVTAAVAGCRNSPLALPGINRVGIVAADNHTEETELSAEFTGLLQHELSRRFAIELVVIQPSSAGLPANQAMSFLTGPEAIIDLSRRYGVDAIVLSALDDYGEDYEGRLSVKWHLGQSVEAGFKIEAVVDLTCSARLMRADDGTTVLSRENLTVTRRTEILEAGPPPVSLEITVAPHLKRLRKEALGQAVDELIDEVKSLAE